MRFQTKFDRWLIFLLVLAAAVTLSPPCVAVRAPRSITLLPWVLWTYLLLATLPQYYEFRPDGLFIRQGVRKSLIPYSSVVQVVPRREIQSAGVYSMDRIYVVTGSQGNFTIAPREQDRFLEELSRRTPQLQRKGFGLEVAI